MQKSASWSKRLIAVFCLCAMCIASFCGCNQTGGQNSAAPDSQIIPENPGLAKNNYAADCFGQQDGFYTYADGERSASLGVDVSYYQGEIDWEAVRDAGITFAMIRVGYRGYVNGELVLDDYFLRNMDGALAAGLQVGAYFFSQAVNAEEAEEEASFVLRWIDGYDLSMPVVFDWEDTEDHARTAQVDVQTLTGCAESFCSAIEAAGYTAAVYFNQHMGYQRMNLGKLKAYTFWLAEYAAVPTFYYRFELWQYTNSGTVPGIDTTVDLNLCFLGPEHTADGSQEES